MDWLHVFWFWFIIKKESWGNSCRMKDGMLYYFLANARLYARKDPYFFINLQIASGVTSDVSHQMTFLTTMHILMGASKLHLWCKSHKIIGYVICMAHMRGVSFNDCNLAFAYFYLSKCWRGNCNSLQFFIFFFLFFQSNFYQDFSQGSSICSHNWGMITKCNGGCSWIWILEECW